MKIQLLTSPGCHICAEVKKTLEEIRPNFPALEIEEIDIVTPEGQAMVQKYGIFASPGVIINGELFSAGGVNKEKLIEKLTLLNAREADLKG